MIIEIKTKIFTHRHQKSLPLGERMMVREVLGQKLKEQLRIYAKPENPSLEAIIYYGGEFLPEHLWLAPIFIELRKGWIAENAGIMIKQKDIFGFEIHI